MKYSTLATAAFVGTSAAAPQFDLGALLGGLGGAGGAGAPAGGLNLGALLGGLGGAGGAGAPAGGLNLGALLGGLGGAPAAGGAAPAGGFDLGGLLGGLGGLLGGGAAPSAVAAPILAAYASGKTQIDKVSAAVGKLGSGAGDAVVKELVAAGQDVVKGLKDSTAQIAAQSGQVDLFAAVGFMQPGETLTASVEATMNSLIAKKEAVVKANGAAQIVQSLKDQKAAVEGLVAAINLKLPDLAVGIAQGTSQRPIDAYEKAIQAFA